MDLTVLLFGATGTAGSGVLTACLEHPAVREIRVVVRRPLKIDEPRVAMFVHDDYSHYEPIEAAFQGVDACLWCLGISVYQASGEPEYRRITHDFAIAAAHRLKVASPNAVFHYLSGDGARVDSRFMWARVKAETERELAGLMPSVSWRPAYIDGGRTQRGPALFQLVRPLFRVFSFARSIYVTSEDIGRAMLQATMESLRTGVIDNTQIRMLADRARGTVAASSG